MDFVFMLLNLSSRLKMVRTVMVGAGITVVIRKNCPEKALVDMTEQMPWGIEFLDTDRTLSRDLHVVGHIVGLKQMPLQQICAVEVP